MGKWRLGHRPALDGLRGVAILLVVASHTGAPWFAMTGAVGVTLFFALSGFLITGLLLEERERTGHTDLGRFYSRRARRLGPAFLALVAAVAALAPILGDWWLQPERLLPVLLYAGNWIPALDGAGTLGALSVTWSLSIEEQFYLVWPLLIALLARRRHVMVAAASLAGASLLQRLSLIAEGASIDRVYYGSDTVAFGLLMGALMVSVRLRGGPGDGTRPTVLLLVAGGGTIWLLLSYPPLLIMFGLPAVALAAGLALWACTGSRPVRALEAQWLQWLGSRSYGLYLWHGPILWALWYRLEWPWIAVAAAGVPTSLLLAEASWRWVEEPWRKRRSPATGRGCGREAAAGSTLPRRARSASSPSHHRWSSTAS